jgi:4-carboxymuconolactone decarboxylase
MVMGRHAWSGVKVACAVAIAAVSLLTSCAKGTRMTATPQKGIHTSMLSHDDLASVSPALERYRREALEASLWKRTQLSPRDRSIVTIAALIARNQTAEQAHYLALALDHGVRPSEISEIITHLAFYAGWGNAMATIQIAQGVFDTHGVSRSALPPASAPLLPLDQAAEAQRAALVEATVGPVAPGLVEYTRDVLFKDLWLRPALAPRDRSLVTVSALIASGQVAQVTYHLNRAMDSGLTKEEAGEVITHLAFYAGWPNAFSAVPVAKDVFDKRPR